MPRTSSIKLDKNIEKEILKQLWLSISKINSPITASEFVSDILTPTEQLMISKRLACAILLIRDKTPTDIKNSIHITYSTIGTVGAWVKNAKPKTQLILKQFSKEKGWEKILDKIESLLDKLPPRYGSDWKEAGKRKFKRAQKRSVLANLR
jgi:uncharacterized protein YerC